MNNGAFGENFPYSNFHDLNTDWIIKIAKDFLDQYTHIQEIITNGEDTISETIANGITNLEDKATNLEELLQTWYDTHSADIANQLSSALEELNTELLSTISEFNTAANTKTADSIASIPDDYTTLFNNVVELTNRFNADMNIENSIISVITQNETEIPFIWENGHIDTSTGQDVVRDANQRSKGYIPTFGLKVSAHSTLSEVVCYLYEYDENYNFLGEQRTTTSPTTTANPNTKYIRISSYSQTVQQTNLHEYLTASWLNPYPVSDITVVDKILNGITKFTITISGTEGYSTNKYMPIVRGRSYTITNNTSNSIVINTINQDGTFNVVETVGTGISYTFTPTENYYGLRIYFAVSGSCSVNVNDKGAFIQINDNTENLNIVKTKLIKNGEIDDFVILHDTEMVALSIPNKAVFDIETITGEVFETNSVTMYSDDGTTVLNTWNLSPYSGNKRTLTNNSGAGSFVKLASNPPSGIMITVHTTKLQPTKIRVMQYNIGKFNYGQTEGLPSGASTKIANYKQFLAEYQPNICGMEEYTQYIDSDHSYASDQAIFNDLYMFEAKDFEIELAVKSDYDKRDFYNFYIKDDNNETAGVFAEYLASVDNIDLTVVVGVIAAGKAPAVRAGGFENLLDKYADKDNVIILMDTNVISETEHNTLISTATNYNYKVANGGYFGSFNTYNPSSSYYHKIDNILVKGNMKLKNVIVPDVYADLSSDHYPIIADIELYH